MTQSVVLDWFRSHASSFSGQLHFDEPLARHTYFRIGGPASVFAIPKSIADIHWLKEGLRQTGIPFFVLGQGSNILASDQGFSGLIIRANKLNLEISASSLGTGALLRTGASVAISSLLRRAAQEGWVGLEFLTGIPGLVGGAVFMNAGTHLGETQSRLRKVEVYSLLNSAREAHVYEGTQLDYQYRKNFFLPSGSLIWAAEWEVQQGDPAQVKAIIDETLARRKATQPLEAPSCGSVFKNPKESGLLAWQVVDRLGLRGHQIGGAQFAEKHSNWILNKGGAKAADVAALIALAKSRAVSELGVVLEEEVIYLGEV